MGIGELFLSRTSMAGVTGHADSCGARLQPAAESAEAHTARYYMLRALSLEPKDCMNPRIIRRLAAVLVAAIGVMNIVSAVHPAVHARLEILKDLVSLDIIRGSHTAAVLAGFFLILLADGLRTRRKRPLHLTVLLLVLSTILNLPKGLAFDEINP